MPKNSKDDISTQAGKREFLTSYMNSIRDSLIAKIDRMPEEWNGFELRWLVADTCNFEQMRRGAPEMRRRFRDYDNERLTRNL